MMAAEEYCTQNGCGHEPVLGIRFSLGMCVQKHNFLLSMLECKWREV